MKLKKGMRALFVLLAMLLVSVVVVSAVSAIDNVHVAKSLTLAGSNAVNSDIAFSKDLCASEELAGSVILTPDFRTQDLMVSSSLSEKDLITIIFPDEWLAEKNISECPERIVISDSKETLKIEHFDDKTGLTFFSPIAINDTQSMVSLRIPKKMYELSIAMGNGSISFPMKYFTHHSNLNNMLTTIHISSPSEPEIYVPVKARTIEYVSPPVHGEWAHYSVKPEYTDSIVHLEGMIKPSLFTNNGHDHAIYQEREIYLNGGDVVEYILFYDEDYYGDKIWLGAAIYDNSNNPQGCPTIKWFDATSCHWYDYEFTIYDQSYYIWFRDCTTGNWKEHIYYDEDDPSYAINRICGSAEVYADVPAQYSFEAITYPMIDEYARTSGGTTKLPGEVFSFSGWSGDTIYSFMNTWVSSSQIYTYHENDSTL
ncbi:MAG: hypothetical protein U9N40_07885 [Euryarchaeota archaeon]|nr:hypothetical protein [Euryarchaeota archaeon]